ncbi:MAG: hypothetical protein DLM60_18570, partial [Pseudonocardiales bacterium]
MDLPPTLAPDVPAIRIFRIYLQPVFRQHGEKERDVLDVNFFDELRIGLATAEDIRQWSFGEV